MKQPSSAYCVFMLFIITLVVRLAFAQEDHTLVSKYAGSTIKDKKVESYGEYQLVTGQTDKGEFIGEKLKGKVTRVVYENPPNRSTLEIFTNYKQALQKSGIEIIYTCEMNACGPAYARSAWNRYNGLFAAADGDPRYLGGKITQPNGVAYVALMVGRLRTQLDVVEITGMEENLVVVNVEALAKGIDQDGKVSIYGIYFDSDKAEIKSESKPALDEIAKFLQGRPALKLFVVGHTDMTGGFSHNQSLSELRAKAVVNALVNSYSIAATRLEPYGVGPLAPVTSNASPAGRAKNRRVELVAQ
jgi:outer membrane protein OmpA-like peptidoglycan-associated protein